MNRKLEREDIGRRGREIYRSTSQAEHPNAAPLPGTLLDEVTIDSWFHLNDLQLGQGLYDLKVGPLNLRILVGSHGEAEHISIREEPTQQAQMCQVDFTAANYDRKFVPGANNKILQEDPTTAEFNRHSAY